METSNLIIDNLKCTLYCASNTRKIAYLLYPMDLPARGVLEQLAEKYNVNITFITGMDWQNVFSPWPAPGVPKGTADFKGESPEFLKLLQEKVIPQVEAQLSLSQSERTLFGVSMSGLFALLQWMVCDTFTNIASLSGSFWYNNFLSWMKRREIPEKSGKAFFLLGNQESKSNVPAFNTVAKNTSEIISLLQCAGINAVFQSVPGNHYQDAVPRLKLAFSAIYSEHK